MKNNYLHSICTLVVNRIKQDGSSVRNLIAFSVFFLTCLSGQAQDYTVTTTADGPSSGTVVTLRGAITAADALTNNSTHTITLPAGLYNLTAGQISFGNRAQNIVINGAGPASTTIAMAGTGANQDRIFNINPPGTNDGVQTTITGITFLNGHLTSDPYGGGAIGAGGPSSVLALTNCAFINNTCSGNGDGGAVSAVFGCAFSVNNCTFKGNSGTNGGAISFFAYSSTVNNAYLYPSASLSITNSTFTSNSASSNSQGGAISLLAQGFNAPYNPTLSVSITKNSFVGNSAPGSGGNGRGGAIAASNAFSPSNVYYINYNRFTGNTAGLSTTSALVAFDQQGNVDATNNWWGCNTGAADCNDKAFRFAGSSTGTLTTTPYLKLRTIAASSSVCSGNLNGITADFTINSASSTISAGNLAAFTAVPISFSATLGSISNAQTTLTSGGVATATYTAGNTAGAGTASSTVDGVTTSVPITVNAGPTPTDQPDNVTGCIGSTVSFVAAASGSGLSYQWYKGATALNNGASGNGSTFTITSTANSSTLTISGLTAADAASTYKVGISSSGCSVTSNTASLVVNTPPSVTSSPASVTTCPGTTATFTAQASGGGTLSYRWYKGASPLSNGATGTGSTISGATTLTLTIANTSAADAAANYNLQVSSNLGCASVTSNNAALVISSLPVATASASGTLTCTQTSVTLTAGGGSSYTFGGAGIVSQNAASGKAVVNASGTFSVTVTNSSGCSSTTTVVVSANQTPPTVSINPTSVTLTNASPTTSLTAIGTGTFKWSTGATSSVISVTSSGVYSVTLTNPAGCTASASTPVTGSDLTITLELPEAQFAASGTASVGNFVVNVFEVGGLPTSSGSVRITVTVPAGYTLSFPPNITSIAVSGGSTMAVSNGQWQVSNSVSNLQLTLTMASGAFISGGGSSIIGFTITRTSANSGSTSNISVNVADDLTMTYDGNLSNNVYARIISGL